MRPVRTLLVAIAVLAVGLTAGALGARGGYSGPHDAATATTAAAPEGEPAAARPPLPTPGS